MTAYTPLLEKEFQPFPLMKLPSPIRRNIYECAILMLEDWFSGDPATIRITQFVRSSDFLKHLYHEVLYPVGSGDNGALADASSMYLSGYSPQSINRIQNLASILPKEEREELQRAFWHVSVFNFAKPLTNLTRTRRMNPFTNFPNINPVIQSIWPDAKVSSVRHLAVDLDFLHDGNGQEFLLRLIRLRFELDSLTITWGTTLTHAYYVRSSNIPIELIKSMIVHKTFIFDLRLMKLRRAYVNSLDELQVYVEKLAPWNAAMYRIFLPYTLMEGYNKPFREHDSFGLERLYREKRDELDERLAYENEREMVVWEMKKHFTEMSIRNS